MQNKTIPQIIADLICNEVSPRLKKKGIGFADSPITPQMVREAAIAKHLKIISTSEIRQIFDDIMR